MVQIFVVAIAMLMVSTINLATLPIESNWHESRGQQLKWRVERLGDAIAERYLEAPGDGLVSPEQITQVTGYEYLRFDGPQFFQTAVANGIAGGNWSFNRRVIWLESPTNYVGEEKYVDPANNSCGNGSLELAASWCGRHGSIWAKVETRESNNALLLAEKQRLFRTMSKFVRTYTRNHMFNELAPGSVMSLPAMVGYAGTAAECSGLYIYQGMPLTCENLFNQWGNPIVLNQISARHIALVDRTGVIQASGTPVRLAEEMILE